MLSLQEEFKPLTKWWKEQLRSDAKIDAVKLSKRLSSTPCVVLASKVGCALEILLEDPGG